MITFIGNNANQQIVTDGGRLKMRLFIDLLKKNGNDINVIELDGWKKRFLGIICSIKKAIKRNDRIVIMAGPKGCRYIIPIVCFFNKKRRSKVIYCPVGIGTIDKLLKNFSQDKINSFINCIDFYGIKDKRMGKHLASLDWVCPENEIQNKLYKTFYGLSNTCVIENFRDIEIVKKQYIHNDSKTLSIIFASRVKEYKGILDLMEVVKYINSESDIKLKLNIFGDNQLEDQNKNIFNDMLDENIVYHGEISTSKLIDEIRNHDLFCLPTRYYGEGTSGALVESMISGTPALVSSYSQVSSLIIDNKNGFIFKIGSKEHLKTRLAEIVNNKKNLESIGLEAQRSAEKYTYSYNKDTFIKIMVGEQK